MAGLLHAPRVMTPPRAAEGSLAWDRVDPAGFAITCKPLSKML
jgi:hypothetical protein